MLLLGGKLFHGAWSSIELDIWATNLVGLKSGATSKVMLFISSHSKPQELKHAVFP